MRKLLPSLLCLLSAKLMNAEPIRLQSSTNHTALLELFTSEGCSSCPPAEKWFSELRSADRLWKDFVPVSFHVDYWDHLGWRDPLGSPEFSERQRLYSERGQTRSVYTPGFMLNGREWLGWFNHDPLPIPSTNQVGVLSAESEDGRKWKLRFDPAFEKASTLEFHAASLGFELSSDVKAGENRGHQLVHDFAALALASVGSERKGDSFAAELTLSPAVSVTPKRRGIAVWVTRRKDTKPIQATGGWLPTIQ